MKSIFDYTLNEVMEICNKYIVCWDCPFCKNNFCIFENATPEYWKDREENE